MSVHNEIHRPSLVPRPHPLTRKRKRFSPGGARGVGTRLRPTDRPCPSHSRDTDTLHVPTLPRGTSMPCSCHVNSAVRSRDSYKTENADDGKAKSRDTRATNCEAGTRERPANLLILALPCRFHHVSLGFTYISFSRRSLHTSPFSHLPT